MSGYYPCGVTQDDIDRAYGEERSYTREDYEDNEAMFDDDDRFDAVRNCE